MIKYIMIMILLVAAISFATEPNPINNYSIEQLNKYSSAIIDGTIYFSRQSNVEVIGQEKITTRTYILLPHSVLKNSTETNIKRDTDIEFDYIVRSDVDMEPEFGLNIDDNIRLFLERNIRSLDERIVVTSKNQIHPELYGTGKRSDETSVSTVEISPPDTVATPPWYWLVGGVAFLLVFGGVTFRLGAVYERRRTKPVQRANGPANKS